MFQKKFRMLPEHRKILPVLLLNTMEAFSILEQGGGVAVHANLRERNSVFRVVTRFLSFFLLNNEELVYFGKFMNFHRSSHFIPRFKDIRCF